MAGKERLGKVNQIGNNDVVGVGPVGRELKTVAGFAFFALRHVRFLYGIETGRVGVIFGVCTVGNDKNLNVFVQTAAGKERVALIAVDLVERFTDGDTAPLELDMHHREPVAKDRHVKAGIVSGTVVFGQHVLVDDLQTIVVHVLFINQRDIFGCAVVTLQHLHVIFLYFTCLFHDAVVGIGKAFGKEPVPFVVGKMKIVQFFQLFTQIGNQFFFIMNDFVFVALLDQKVDKPRLQSGLALVTVGTGFHRFVFGDYRIFGRLGNDVEIRHGGLL